jgi:hypothetical protein
MIPMLNAVYRAIYNVIRGLTGQGLGPAVRGGASVTVQAMLQMLFMIGGIADFYDDEEEEKIFQDNYRFFLPMFVNMFIEGYKKDSLFDALMLPTKLIMKPVSLISEEVKKALTQD